MISAAKWHLRVFLAAGLAVTSVHAQQAAVPSRGPVYDVVSVKVSKGDDSRMMMGGPPGKYSTTNGMLWLMIQTAYGLQTREMLTGLPGWAESARFDIAAKMDPEALEAMKKLPPKEAAEQRSLMLQALLADRFGLVVHHVTREMPAYALVVSKGGTKLKPADPEHPTVTNDKAPGGVMKPGMIMMGAGMFQGQSVDLDSLAIELASSVHRPVVDRTGLPGKYDIALKWTPDDFQASTPDSAAAAPGPSLMTALEEQLGLKLESTKLPTDTIVIDRLQMPSEN